MNSKELAIVIKARDEASATMQKVSGNVQRTSEQMKTAAKTAALAGIALAVALGVKAVESAGEFESSLSQLRQASNATGNQMNSMAALARKLGADTSLAGVTASDAAKTMVELSKAGLSVNDTMAASRGVMSMAKAGQMDFADAAVLAASALNAFNLRGKDATKVADMLAAGANASQANMTDLGQALQQSATVAKQFGLNMNETVTALALFANNGIKGSDAGTSLKTMLISLAHPSQQASDAMKKIGFSAYDAKGNFVGLRSMSERLSKSLNGLTKEQKQAALATIFGTDAFRAAAVLSDSAGKSYDGMSKSVGKVGAAQQAAAAQLGPFQKSMENLSNTASALGLEIGGQMLPGITSVANAISANAIPAFHGLVAVMQGQVPIITMLGVSMLTFGAIQGAVAFGTKAFTVAMLLLNGVIRSNPIVLLTSVLAGLIVTMISVTSSTNTQTTATDRLIEAKRELKIASEQVKKAQNEEKLALLDKQEADIRVERAQRSYNEAVRQYGPKSLEAREAMLELKRATYDQGTADDNLKAKHKSTMDSLANESKKAAGIVSANYAMRDSAYAAANGFAAFAANASAAASAASRADVAGRNAANTKNLSLPQFGKTKFRASGGPVSAGQPYIVGEHEPELFVPNTSGKIMNQKQISESGIGGTTFNMYGNVLLGDASSVDRYFDRLNAVKELGAYGVGV